MKKQVDIFSTARRENGTLGRAARTCGAAPPAIVFAGGAADKHPLSALINLRLSKPLSGKKPYIDIYSLNGQKFWRLSGKAFTNRLFSAQRLAWNTSVRENNLKSGRDRENDVAIRKFDPFAGWYRLSLRIRKLTHQMKKQAENTSLKRMGLERIGL